MEYFRRKNEKRYPLGEIHIAYNEDGSFIRPFIVNQAGTAIKDLESDKVEQVQEKRYFLDQSAQKLYGIEGLSESPVPLFVSHYFNSGYVPGRPFKALRNQMSELGYNYYDYFKRCERITDGDWQNELTTISELRPFFNQAKKRLARAKALKEEKIAKDKQIEEIIQDEFMF